MSDNIAEGAARYRELVYKKFDGQEPRVFMAVYGCYGTSHEQGEDEDSAQYIERCLEQDFVDGFNNASMFQDLFAIAIGQTVEEA